MKETSWLIIDTETTGIRSPIFAVEIAAQRMRGWHRDGEPFRVLLNHDVPIEPQAEALHGYSRAYLRKNGLQPRDAHERFRSYAGDRPVVAHNLSYDWDRVLAPEYERLSVPVSGRRGFCALTLARRVVNETPGYSLDALAKGFRIQQEVTHQAWSDVIVVVELFERIYGPRLVAAGLSKFSEVAEFSKRTPVAACLAQIVAKDQGLAPAAATAARTVVSTVINHASDEALKRAAAELREFCRGIVADNVINPQEFVALYQWLEKCPFARTQPLSTITEQVEKIASDGVVTPDELTDLKSALDDFIAT